MNTKHVARAGLTALALSLTLGLAACGSNDNSAGMGGMGSGTAAAPMSPMSPAPSGSPSAAAAFNDADVMFAQMMLPHHEQAVAMSETLLGKSGVSAETTALAQQIKDAQQPEITTLKGWLTAWGQSADGGMNGMDHGGMDGMATADELEKFDQAKGKDAEKRFLEMMTTHHQGAIAMAKTEISDGKHSDAIAMARTIATSQQAEIATMKKLLDGL
ncbi:DUF305 domain-containing protein [uncultured Friedmanniella sp.]|uniref:DUF305 domain-containing protein n=1 Tax=uncultured Friedmanniella sp. TaxID=335381 RepID=UPI0035C9A0E6